MEDDRSLAGLFWADNPDLLDEVEGSDDFQLWRDNFKPVTIDDEGYFILGGDQIQSQAQLALRWAREAGLVEEDMLTATLQPTDPPPVVSSGLPFPSGYDFLADLRSASDVVEDVRSFGTPELSAFERLKVEFPKVELDGEQFWVAEGDILLDENQLEIYALGRKNQEVAFRAQRLSEEAGLGSTLMVPQQSASAGLVGVKAGRKVARWSPGTVLSYRVIKHTFSSEASYGSAVEMARQASLDWENVCGVKFEHRSATDDLPGIAPEGALFTIREMVFEDDTLALAFFPTDPPKMRRVLLGLSLFADDLEFDPVGVMRHEFGHVLGFRHEHIRNGAPLACQGESTHDAQAITEYDPDSVMHYLCGGRGTLELRITETDRTGAQLLYGPSLSKVHFVAP